MSDELTVAAIIGVALLILAGFVLVGLRAERRKSPEERQLDRWRAQSELLEMGYASQAKFEAVVGRFGSDEREARRLDLVRYRALIDAGMSQTGALVHVLGSPDGATGPEPLGPRGEEVVAQAVARYRRDQR